MVKQKLSSKEKIQSVLWSNLSFIHRSSQKEKALFPDKKDGWFYTFGLESGQEFVVYFSLPKNLDDKEASKTVGEITFRPINRLLPAIREIQFLTPKRLEHKVIIKLSPKLKPQEKRKYCVFRYEGFFAVQAPFIQKALNIHELLLTASILKEDLLFNQQCLSEELSPRKKLVTRHIKGKRADTRQAFTRE